MELREVQTKETEKHSQTMQLQKVLQTYNLSLNGVINIIRFLDRKPYLLAVLLEAHEQISKIFGDVPVRLTVALDPEEGWETLSVIIKVKLPVTDALTLLDRFETEWFAKLENIGTELNFDVEII